MRVYAHELIATEPGVAVLCVVPEMNHLR